MLSVSTTNRTKYILAIILFSISRATFSQENSPFSRYGLGDVNPSQNILNRGMGGITSTYANLYSVNFSNPASYSNFQLVVYDLGISIDSRTLKSAVPVSKYSSVNFSPSYVSLGLPLNKAKRLGMAFGLKPITRVNYSIEERRRLQAGDSIAYVYEGEGGAYQAFVGIGKKWGKEKKGTFSVGLNTGYMFGRKENTTRTIPIDSVLTYKSNSITSTSFGSAFVNAGFQYDAFLNDMSILHFGVAGNFSHDLKARQQITRETFAYDFNGNPFTVDSVFKSGEERGTIRMPASYRAGISLTTLKKNKLLFEKSTVGIEYETTQWSDFRFYEQPDKLMNSWLLRVGGQLMPNPASNSYWGMVNYRTGFSFGKDAVNADGQGMSVYTFTLGAGLPVRRYRGSYTNQQTVINTAFEFGKRGSNQNNITESFFRISVGLNLTDVWFVKRRYD